MSESGERSEGLQGRTVSIIGLGASGESAARLALTLGGVVYVSDENTGAAATARADELRGRGASVDLGSHDLQRIATSDLIVTSPGIPPTATVLRELRARSVDWVSEPELAFRFLRAPLIAITGTNGKTTTAVLTAHLLESAGFDVGLGGNIGGGFGPPASDVALLDPAPDWAVWEMSSFQLADVDQFKPRIGVLTNLAPDHLDRYASVSAYYADKARMFVNADAGSSWVLPDEPEALALAEGVPGRRFLFGTDASHGLDAIVEEGVLIDALQGQRREVVTVDDLPLLGVHNQLNSLAALLAARLAGADPHSVASGLRSAQPLAHRLEPVAETEGVLWVNDSKATNVAAARSGILSMTRPVVALLGGKDKGESFAPLRDALSGHARAAVLYGAVRNRLATELEGACDTVLVSGDMEAVVREAKTLTLPGDVVLLSPACSSFDMFENYEARGRAFVSIVRGGN